MSCQRMGLTASALLALVGACSPFGVPPDDGGARDGGGPSADAGPPVPKVIGWEPAFDTSEAGSVSSVWGTAPDDVFAVGGNDEGGTAVHFDGEQWSPMAVPAGKQLVWVRGFAPDDVFAVGLGGRALHYDGSTWTAMGSGTDIDLWGVFGFAPDDVWAVGGATDSGDPVLSHYDGSSFTAETLPAAENPVGAHALFKIWGIGQRLFAVGQFGLIVEHTPAGWVHSPAGDNADDDFVSLWGTAENCIVAVGGRANARIATFDGSSWTTLAPVGMPGLNAVYMDEPGHALVAGAMGTAALFDVETGQVEYEDTDTRWDVHALWGDGAGKHYGVGGNFFAPNHGIALVRHLVPATQP